MTAERTNKENAAADKRVIDGLRYGGSDISKSRHVKARIYAPSEEVAQAVAANLVEEHGDAEVMRVSNTSCLVTTETWMVVNEQTIADLRRDMGKVATSHGVNFDGWQTARLP
jgi:hypothetical protein